MHNYQYWQGFRAKKVINLRALPLKIWYFSLHSTKHRPIFVLQTKKNGHEY